MAEGRWVLAAHTQHGQQQQQQQEQPSPHFLDPTLDKREQGCCSAGGTRPLRASEPAHIRTPARCPQENPFALSACGMASRAARTGH